MVPIRLLLGLAVACAMVGCAAPAERVRVDKIEGELPRCQSFGWHAISGDAASFTDQRVKAAVMEQLKAKGYQEAAEKPDCLIAYHMTTREIPKQKPGVGVGVGGGSGGMHGGIGVSIPIGGRKSGFNGEFTLDVIDAAKNAQVWSGSIAAKLEQAELSDEEAKGLAAEVLKAYPDAS